MKHKQKVKMARKMMSQEELKNHVSIFDSKVWNARAEIKKSKSQKKNNNK